MIDLYRRVMNVEPALPKRPARGFFTDTSLCIGCKACEVACKQWNQLPADGYALSGKSYDNTEHLGATTWRHVLFAEQTANGDGDRAGQRWLMMSDVCKHCANAACLEACPTGALVRTEFDTVYVQQDICNGCGYCVPACPFGVIDRTPPGTFQAGTAHKCTLCYDRLKDDMTPACAKSCPTESIQFGDIEELRSRAERRLGELHARGETRASLYGMPQGPESEEIGPLNAFFLLLDRPETYNLPAKPRLPSRSLVERYAWSGLVAIGFAMVSAMVFGRKAR